MESKKQTVGSIRASIIAKIKTFSDEELLEEAAKHKASDIIDHERWMLANDAFDNEIKLRSLENALDYNLLSKEITDSDNPYDKKLQNKIIKTDADRKELNKIIASWERQDEDNGLVYTVKRNIQITKMALHQVLVNKVRGEDDWNKIENSKPKNSEKDQRLNLIDRLINQGFSPEDAKKKVDGE